MCNSNVLFLNINKRTFIYFYLIQNPINYQYYIFYSKIKFFSEFKNQVNIFDTKLKIVLFI